jgi:hypothetical protein
MSEDYLKLTGEAPTSMADFVKLPAAEFTRPLRFSLVRDREVSMRKFSFSERQTAFILTKAAAVCPRRGTTMQPDRSRRAGPRLATLCHGRFLMTSSLIAVGVSGICHFPRCG